LLVAEAFPLKLPWSLWVFGKVERFCLFQGQAAMPQVYPATINVTVANKALDYETFQVIVNANATTIFTQSVTLTGGNSGTVVFSWDATGFAVGNYTISAYVSPAPGEADTADNTYVGGTVEVLAIPASGGGGRMPSID